MIRPETRTFESPDSSNVVRASWTGSPELQGLEAAGELRVTFRNGESYAYSSVPVIVFDRLRTAESVGKAFHTLVRQGEFTPRRLDERVLPGYAPAPAALGLEERAAMLPEAVE